MLLTKNIKWYRDLIHLFIYIVSSSSLSMTFTIDEYVYMAVSVIKSEEETRGCDETTQIYIYCSYRWYLPQAITLKKRKNHHIITYDTLKNRGYNYRMKINARDHSFDDKYSKWLSLCLLIRNDARN
jgi:hypothetical protein